MMNLIVFLLFFCAPAFLSGMVTGEWHGSLGAGVLFFGISVAIYYLQQVRK